MATRGSEVAETLLENPIAFPDGSIFERIRPIIDFRRDPNEARILYLCRRLSNRSAVSDENSGEEECIVKIKVQYVIAALRATRNDELTPLDCPHYHLNINKHRYLVQVYMLLQS